MKQNCAELQAETGESALVLRCLLNRSLTSAEEISRFLAPDFPAHLHAPTLLRDMSKAVERLRQACATASALWSSPISTWMARLRA